MSVKSRQNPVYRFSFRWSWSTKSAPLGTFSTTSISDLNSFKTCNDEIKSLLNEIGSDFIFQLELTNSSGRENWHWQGFLKTEQRHRPKELAKKLNSSLRGIEISACSNAGIEALKSYVMKEESRQSGPFGKRDIYLGNDLYKIPFPWQRELEELVDSQPDNRTIHWVYDPAGNSGKSQFTKKMGFKKGAVPLKWTSETNITNLVSKNPSRCYIFDLTRTKPFEISEGDIYSSMESIKGGTIINTKYECKISYMNPPHVIVFSNQLPRLDRLTNDRWKIHTINDLKKLVDYIPPPPIETGPNDPDYISRFQESFGKSTSARAGAPGPQASLNPGGGTPPPTPTRYARQAGRGARPVAPRDALRG